jgi:hypothetical protein
MSNLIPVVVAAVVLASASPAAAQGWGRPAVPRQGACFYEDANYQGRYFCTPVGATTEQVPPDVNDAISSIRVFGNADVAVFRDANFRGSSKTFSENVRDLREEGLNDRISSYRVDSQGFGRGAAAWDNAWGRPARPQAGVCFYKNPNFGGDYFCSTVGAFVAQVPRGTNDTISSIQLFGNVQVTLFRDSDYRGQSQTVGDDVRDLRRSGWNDLVSSYRVEPLRFGRDGRGGANQGDWGRGASGGSRYTRQQAEAIVARAYRAVFNREPDPAAAGWVDRVMASGWTERQLIDELRKSDEYRNRERSR